MNQEKVGSFIKKLRQDNNLTQAEFASKLGVTYQAVSKWENGKNVPDIATMKEISNLFNINIDDIISGEVKEKAKKKNMHIIVGVILILILLLVVILLSIHIFKNKTNDDFEFKVISSTCDNFNISGSLAYSNDKSNIYISNIEFCGDEDIVYESIECILYEKYGNTINEIAKCHIGYDETLKEHLKKVKISSDNYLAICNRFDESSLYLEINAVSYDGKTTTYKIPLQFDSEC